MRWIADFDEIKDGKTTDVYFQRTGEILKALKKDPVVVAEFSAKTLPPDYNWAVFTGLADVIEILRGLKVNLYALPEGSVFYKDEPVMMIEGRYSRFGILETAILGLICQASGIATKAARCRLAAGKRTVLSFGARRMHPVISPMIERNAYIGGCDGVSTILAAEELKIKPSGTIPHALILITGSLESALKAFDKKIDKNVKRIALIDTFGDEKFEAITAAETLGKKLYGIRFDTPRSRRGDLPTIIKEVRWELDIRGYRWVKIFASGGINEDSIKELNEVCDGYGIGTILSNARVIDFAMDIVEIDKKPIAKRGKRSGMKDIISCSGCRKRLVVKKGTRRSCHGPMQSLIKNFIKKGRLLRPLPDPDHIRNHLLQQLRSIS